MCGRYVLTKPTKVIAEHFDLFEPPVDPMSPRYNASPTERLPVIRRDAQGRRRLDDLRWGFVLEPRGRDALRRGPLINARSETVDEKPTFRAAFRQRRALVPADGFYEWRKEGTKKSRPFWIGFRDRRLFAFAGLWERDAFTILTTGPSPLVQPLHDRMPVILAPTDYERWLDPSVTRREALEDLFAPFPDAEMEVIEVKAPGEPRIPV